MQGFLAPNFIIFHLVLVSSPSKKTHNDRSAALTPALTLNTFLKISYQRAGKALTLLYFRKQTDNFISFFLHFIYILINDYVW